jgi:hypothetical protein
LQKYKRSGALKQNGHPSAVDLRSNGHGCMRAPWTTPCARRTGPRWTEAKGYPLVLIRIARAKSDGHGRVRAGRDGWHAGVRRRAAGAHLRWLWTALPATFLTTGWGKMQCWRLRT